MRYFNVNKKNVDYALKIANQVTGLIGTVTNVYQIYDAIHKKLDSKNIGYTRSHGVVHDKNCCTLYYDERFKEWKTIHHD